MGKWISVKDRLPELTEEDNGSVCVLICNCDQTLSIAFINSDGQWEGDMPASVDDPSHWQPLPEPPE